MGVKGRDFRQLPEGLALEALVPGDNFYRRLEERIEEQARQLNLSFSELQRLHDKQLAAMRRAGRARSHLLGAA